jgi:peroxiredoxin family protein
MEPVLAETERLSVILLSGSFERVHYGLAIASAAAALGRKVTLFATLAATRGFLGSDPEGRFGWAGLRPGPDLARPELADGLALDARNRARGVAGFEELLQACVGLGVEIIVCEMGLRAEGLAASALRPDLPIQRAGLATVLARPGQIIAL